MGKHGLSRTRIYKRWRGMMDRCSCQNTKDYERYGGRGITVCEEWQNDFMAFYRWSMENGYREELDERGRNKLSLDREDNDKGYSPDNCRWTDRTTQQRNTRIHSTNKTGERGVHIVTDRNGNTRYKAVMRYGNKRKSNFIGYYDTLQEAATARKQAEIDYWQNGKPYTDELSKNNTSGVKGVSYSKDMKKWQAYITRNYKKVNLGFYDTIAEAAEARRQAEI